ncbi:alpha/beta fold hydrolase [Oceanirhabdus seepicola]|uniref:Alpha/beta hydrolase n=1 Tax=Oceanirhabdus seepicola TaxID=2828781 RepID=A0A9J6P5C4_9CLOT|nr:alpha/beta hydrolase [Oceanirhabdus seepicola]MCM1991452.1 alpha/beta hydrolase [Oceanirhabdus seepicola]
METKNILRKTTKILGYSLCVIIILFILWVLISNILTVIEKKNNLPIGKMVEIDGKEMHVYTKGEGKDTIVLLSGLGTAAPVLDFMPLTDELSKKYRVVVVENFGYGWSDLTDKERTVEKIVEETRSALKKSGIQGPYILMPHSISGVYSMYYANTYPEEVKAIIGIDCSMPNMCEYFGEPSKTLPKCTAWAVPTGIARLGLLITPDSFLPIARDGAYSKDDLNLIKMISGWKLGNKNIVSEVNEIQNNLDKTIKMSYPKELPVLIFTYERSKKREDGKTSVSFYETYLNDLDSGRVIVLEGHHYLHWTCSEEMTKEVNAFIDECLN